MGGIGIFIAILLFAISVLILRWAFRINHIVQKLDRIVNQLESVINALKEGFKIEETK
jgi:hypothetical protein